MKCLPYCSRLLTDIPATMDASKLKKQQKTKKKKQQKKKKNQKKKKKKKKPKKKRKSLLKRLRGRKGLTMLTVLFL